MCKTLDYSFIQRGGSRFDLLKFVLAMFIVAMHSRLFPTWLLPLPRLAVPLFFIMTSYFFHVKLNEASSSGERQTRLLKYVKRNLQLYLFWSIALLPIIVVLHVDWFRHGVSYAVLCILKSVFVTGFFGASWFILGSVYAVLIVYFLSRWLNNGWLLLIALIVYILALLDTNYGGLLSPVAQERLSSLNIRWSLNLPAALVWVVIGKMLADRPLFIKFDYLYLLIALTAIAYYGEYLLVNSQGWSIHNDCYVMSMPLCTLIFVAMGQSKDLKCKCSLWMRKTSIIVYCLHLSFIRLLQLVCAHSNLNLPNVAIYAITLILSLSIASGIIYLSEKKSIKLLKRAY